MLGDKSKFLNWKIKQDIKFYILLLLPIIYICVRSLIMLKYNFIWNITCTKNTMSYSKYYSTYKVLLVMWFKFTQSLSEIIVFVFYKKLS